MFEQLSKFRNKSLTSFELKKHVATIQCANALSLLQRKISNALLFHAYKSLLEKEEHQIDIKQLCRLIGYDSHDHQLIKAALRRLLSTVLEWNIVHESQSKSSEVWSASSILASVSIEGSLCRYAYSPRMKELLHIPSMYGRIDLIVQNRFRSAYALALYENCIRYRDLPQTAWFDMELFRRLMGVDVRKYRIFRDFKRRIIDKSVDEVNQFSPLIVTPEYRRLQRKVVAVRFLIDDKPSTKKQIGAKSMPICNRLLEQQLRVEWHMTAKQVNDVLSTYEPSYVEHHIHQVKNSQPYCNGVIKNLTTYLQAVLKANMHQQRRMVDQTQSLGQRQQTQVNRRLKARYHAYLLKYISTKLTREDHNALIESFEAHLTTQFTHLVWKYYQRDGFEHPAVLSTLIQFVEKYHSAILEPCDSFEMFCRIGQMTKD